MAPTATRLYTGNEGNSDAGVNFRGAVSVFDAPSGNLLDTWLGPHPVSREFLGVALAAFPDFLAVGAQGGLVPAPPDGQLAQGPGVVHLLDPNTGDLLQDLVSPQPGQFGGEFGWTLAASNELLWIGAPRETSGATVTAGRVYLFGPVGHTLSVLPQAVPSTVESGGSVFLPTDYDDSEHHTGLLWSWTDHGAGGTFTPSAFDRNPTYIAPVNTSPNPRVITLTVTGTCEWYFPWISASADVQVTVNGTGGGHTLSVTGDAIPTTTTSGGHVTLSATYVDSQDHTGLAWSWSDHGAGGTFLPSANVQDPTYLAPTNTSPNPLQVTLTVTGICEWYWPWVTATYGRASHGRGGFDRPHALCIELRLPDYDRARRASLSLRELRG